MESHELLGLFRCDVVDDAEPYLWSNSEAYQYMNDAYFMFARLTGGIADGSSSVTTLVAAEGVSTTAIHKSIMRVRTAKNVTRGHPIKVINVQDVDTLTSEDYGVIRIGSDVDTPGDVQYMIIGEQDDYVRWIHLPDEDTTVQLVVERLPLVPISGPRQLFSGVRDEHHYHLMKWMRHLAYRKQDADTFNLAKSDQERDDFIAYCAMAKTEKGIRKHKVRTTSYGGI